MKVISKRFLMLIASFAVFGLNAALVPVTNADDLHAILEAHKPGVNDIVFEGDSPLNLVDDALMVEASHVFFWNPGEEGMELNQEAYNALVEEIRNALAQQAVQQNAQVDQQRAQGLRASAEDVVAQIKANRTSQAWNRGVKTTAGSGEPRLSAQSDRKKAAVVNRLLDVIEELAAISLVSASEVAIKAQNLPLVQNNARFQDLATTLQL